MDKNNQTARKLLFQQILKLQTEEECALFFDDLCTIKELDAMSQRIAAAKLILEGKTYNEIVKETEISTATLSRVSKCVQYGKGYVSVLKK